MQEFTLKKVKKIACGKAVELNLHFYLLFEVVSFQSLETEPTFRGSVINRRLLLIYVLLHRRSNTCSRCMCVVEGLSVDAITIFYVSVITLQNTDSLGHTQFGTHTVWNTHSLIPK